MSEEVPVIVVTGAAGGLGSHLVGRFIATGARVFALDRAFGVDSSDAGIRVVADLAQPVGVEAAVQRLERDVPHVDLLVNCAGVFVLDSSGSSAWHDVDHLFRNNLTSMMMLSLGLEGLLSKGSSPSVVNIASTDGVVASAGQDSELGVADDIFYAVSKGAVVTFTRALAMKWASLGVRVNAICPTIFDSPMTEMLLADVGRRDRLAEDIPMGRLASKVDIAEAVVALHSLKFTTGHVLPVDGGYLCR